MWILGYVSRALPMNVTKESKWYHSYKIHYLQYLHNMVICTIAQHGQSKLQWICYKNFRSLIEVEF